MRDIINKIISSIKKEEFILDKQIPLSYIISFFYIKLICFFYGSLFFGIHKRVFIHPSCKIKCKSKIKTGINLSIDRKVYIDALSRKGIRFGKNVSVGKYTTIECTGSLKNIGEGLILGDNVGLGTHGFFGCAGGITIGRDCIFGNYVSIHSENHNYERKDYPIRLQGVNRKGITIGENCWIGAKVTILDGTIIGNGCVIAAGAVVRGYFPDNTVIGGIPARVLKNR